MIKNIGKSENSNTKRPRISFGIIVLNGEPFTKYCLRSLYRFAHEIIIVEGATKNAKSISTHDGHSIDYTLKSIAEFIHDEDTEKKVKLITKDGFWEEKNEMSQAYSSIASGNYLWQVDIDEFYLEEDIEKVVSILKQDSSITAISFKTLPFWGGIKYIEEGPILGDFHRLFKFGSGYKYINHRPPTVVDSQERNLRNINWLDGAIMQSKYNIYLYHYYLVFPLQAKAKADYYSNTFKKNYIAWLNNNYLNLKNPFHVGDNFESISWLKRYSGKHPRQILEMMDAIKDKVIDIKERDNSDVERILKSPTYIISTCFLRFYFKFIIKCKRLVKKTLISLNIMEVR
jgi:hypothetical protein